MSGPTSSLLQQSDRAMRRLGGQIAMLAAYRDLTPEDVADLASIPISQVESLLLGRTLSVSPAAVLLTLALIGGQVRATIDDKGRPDFSLTAVPDAQYVRPATQPTVLAPVTSPSVASVTAPPVAVPPIAPPPVTAAPITPTSVTPAAVAPNATPVGELAIPAPPPPLDAMAMLRASAPAEEAKKPGVFETAVGGLSSGLGAF